MSVLWRSCRSCRHKNLDLAEICRHWRHWRQRHFDNFMAANVAVDVVDAVVTGYFWSHLQHMAFVKVRGRIDP